MRMSYHYFPGARWVFAVATVFYVLAAGVAPVLHSAEEAHDVREHASVLSELDHVGTHSWPSPPAPHEPDDLSCLLCQVMTNPAHASSPETGLLDAPATRALAPASTPLTMRAARITAGARAPPHLT